MLHVGSELIVAWQDQYHSKVEKKCKLPEITAKINVKNPTLKITPHWAGKSK